MRLLSGPARAGVKAGSFKYRLWLNEQIVGQGEVFALGGHRTMVTDPLGLLGLADLTLLREEGVVLKVPTDSPIMPTCV